MPGSGGEGAGSGPSWLSSVVVHGGDAIAVFDAGVDIVFANDALHDLLGFPRGQLLGTNALDLVHPDELQRAAVAIVGVGGGARPLPGLLSVRQGDGSYAVLELNPSSVDLPGPPDGPGPVTVVSLRDNVLQDANWRFLAALTAGEPMARCLELLCDALSHDSDGPMSIAYDRAGRRVAVGLLPPELAGVTADGGLDDTAGTPWAEAVRTGRPAWSAVEDLPDHLVEAGRAAGAACVAVPVPDPGTDRPAVIVQWPHSLNMVDILREALARRPCQAVTLALQRRDTFERLERQALEDPLTGVANRTAFFAALERLAASDAPYGVCYLDLDHFKRVNDQLGHVAGDEVLVACARRLEGTARPVDLVARLGGDEFAVACPDVSAGSLELLAERIVAALGVPVPVDGRRVGVGATVGCAVGDPGSAPDGVVARADGALYEAKRSGRSRWRRAP